MAREISLIGFHFSKISAEKKSDFKGKIEINPKINIASIEKQELSLIKQDALKIIFSFNINYKDLAEINLEGEIILKVDSKTLKDTLKSWKEKKLDQEIQILILNLIMQKASVRAIALEEEMGLPIHVTIPRLQVSKKD